jgi:hypothetical protein
MRRSVRIFVIMLLAAFVAGTAFQLSAAAAMSSKMSMAALAGDMEMGDCENCPDTDDGAGACANPCVMASMMLPVSPQVTGPAIRGEVYVPIPFSLAGRLTPPDPYPPRSIILS